MVAGVFLVVILVALIVGIALTNSSSSGSGSRIRTVERCRLPKVEGDCRAFVPSWYFDAQTGDCKEFGYGGCGGNENRFSSSEECRGACVTEGESVEDF